MGRPSAAELEEPSRARDPQEPTHPVQCPHAEVQGALWCQEVRRGVGVGGRKCGAQARGWSSQQGLLGPYWTGDACSDMANKGWLEENFRKSQVQTELVIFCYPVEEHPAHNSPGTLLSPQPPLGPYRPLGPRTPLHPSSLGQGRPCRAAWSSPRTFRVQHQSHLKLRAGAAEGSRALLVDTA